MAFLIRALVFLFKIMLDYYLLFGGTKDYGIQKTMTTGSLCSSQVTSLSRDAYWGGLDMGLLLKRPQPGHTLFKALLYLRQHSSVSSPFAIYDCPISVCHGTAVSISSIYPFSACIQPRGIVKQILF